ncbi:unnamed protein product [Prorocentrum cordatum]|uniref:Solute carrier family 40 member n=1 Tax=Prorocentrum cordatum TaxID=2364126 RepID=A0ABN9WT46_9DINO|nr:unnamed protein product [Polarella glacialis]
MDGRSSLNDEPLCQSPTALNSARVRYKILASYASARLGAQVWVFAIPPVLVEFTPESVVAPALWGMSTMLATVILGPSLGRQADRTCRLMVITSSVRVQCVTVIGSMVVIALGVLRFRSMSGNWTLLTMFIACEVLAKLGEQLADVSLKREWVPRLFSGETLQTLNSAMSFIDLSAQVVSPLIASLLVALGAFSAHRSSGLDPNNFCLVAAGALHAASLWPQLQLLRSVHGSHAELLRPAPEPASGGAGKRGGPGPPEGGAWSAWRRHAGGLPLLSLSEALLYLTVLSPASAMLRGILQLRRVPTWQASLAGAAGAALGAGGTLARPALGRRFGERAADGVSVCWEAACVVSAALCYRAAAATPEGGSLPILAFLGAACASRLGLFAFCLGMLNRKQRLVEARCRSAVGAVDAALTSAGSLLTYTAGLYLGHASQFWLLVDLSAFFVTCGACVYLLWAALYDRGDPGSARDLGPQQQQHTLEMEDMSELCDGSTS